MYYKTANLTKYLKFVLRWRILIILLTIFSSTTLLFTIPKSTFINNESYWIQGTKSEISYTTKIFFTPDEITPRTIAELKKSEIALIHTDKVLDIESIFSHKKLFNDGSNPKSSLIKVQSSNTLSPKNLLNLIQSKPDDFSTVIQIPQKTVTFFVFSSEPLDLSNFESAVPFHTNNTDEGDVSTQNTLYIILTIVLFIGALWVVFKNIVSGISATLIVGASTISSVAFINFFFPDLHIHITSLLIIVSISLMDFLFFYFRWHTSQAYVKKQQDSLDRSINRNFYPSLFTVIIAVFSLVPFIFLNSEIINLLALSTITPSIFVFLFNMTTLPAFLSYFSATRPEIPHAKMLNRFSNKTINYNKNILLTFIGATLLLSVFWVLQFAVNPDILTSQQKEPSVLSFTLQTNDFNADAIAKIDKFITATQNHFPNIKTVDSVPTIIRTILSDDTFLEDEINEAYFFLQLYKVSNEYISETGDCKITFLMDNSIPHPSNISSWVVKNSPYKTTVSNFCSVVEAEKTRNIQMTSQSILGSFFLISLFIGFFFRSIPVAISTFITSIVPIAWFSFFIWVFNLPITVEVFIAMILAVSLSSVSSVHFAYKFWRTRYFGGTISESLSYSYFHSSLPVIIGSVTLCIAFASLYFSSIPSLQLIGAYSFFLTLFSLLADIFILPILLLYVDKYSLH